MADVVSREKRSQMMAGIGPTDTKPELIVRKALHRLGFRYRLHARDLPGKPDLVFPKYHTVIFVNGCFWHGHDCKYGRVKPKTRPEFWSTKIQANSDRDARNLDRLHEMGWKTIVVWECETKDIERFQELLRQIRTDLAQGRR